MSTVVFTICARNYTGLAKVLQRSVARHGADVAFRIYVVDVEDGGNDVDSGASEVLSAARALRDIIPSIEYANMAFMYDVTEFCTSIKAACFQHVFAEGYETCIYMDPDIFVAADMAHILSALDGANILMTPHLCLPSSTQGPRADSGILATGVYNLGFLALRAGQATHMFLAWWHQRLRTQAFNDHYNALYTDQRWMDFVPSLFPAQAVQVWRHLGCNVAPWNYHERLIEARGDGFAVRARQPGNTMKDEAFPLVFLHFSGFDFRSILDGTFDQLNLADAETHDDVRPLYDLYGTAIRAVRDDMAAFLALPYGFATFADGSEILPSHRRLFRVWRERHGDVAAPFATGPGSFHAALQARGLLARPGGRDLAADKATARTIGDAGRLLRRARQLFRLAFRTLGRARFFLLVRSLNRLSRTEEHYDTFDLDDAVVTGARQ